jgi:small subunit ribosomal protein S16
MLTIRLQRAGKKNQADFKIVLAEKEAPVKKKHLEVLGAYSPRKKTFKAVEERIKYWISQRVEMSPTVHNLLVSKGLLDAKKVKAFNTPKKPVEAAKVEAKSEAVAPAETPTEAPKAE